MRKLSKEIKRHKGEKNIVSFIANLVLSTVLIKPTNLKSPMARKRNIKAIARAPYLKYFLFKYLSKKPRLAIVIKAKTNKPTETIRLAILPGFNLFVPLEFVGKTSSYQSVPPKLQ